MGTIRSPWLSYGKSMKPMGIAAKNQTGPWKMTTKITLYMWISIYNNFTIFFKLTLISKGRFPIQPCLIPIMWAWPISDTLHLLVGLFVCIIYKKKYIYVFFSSGLTQYYISQADCWFYKSHFYWWIPPLLIVHPGNLTAPPCKNPAPSPSQS